MYVCTYAHIYVCDVQAQACMCGPARQCRSTSASGNVGNLTGGAGCCVIGFSWVVGSHPKKSPKFANLTRWWYDGNIINEPRMFTRLEQLARSKSFLPTVGPHAPEIQGGFFRYPKITIGVSGLVLYCEYQHKGIFTMANIDDAQTTAIYYGKGQALPSSVSQGAGVSIVQAPTSGTAFQVSATRACNLYVNVRTAAALATAIGPDSSTAIALDASQSDALGMTTLHVPAGWYVKLTGTMANLTITAVLL